MLLKHSYPLPKHIVSLFRSFAKEKASFMGVGGGKNTLLVLTKITNLNHCQLVTSETLFVYFLLWNFSICVRPRLRGWVGVWPGQVSKCWFEEAEPIIASPTSSTHTESHRPTGPATQPLHRPSMSSRAAGGKWFHIPAFGALGTLMVVGCWLVGWETELGWSKEPITRSSNLVWSLH